MDFSPENAADMAGLIAAMNAGGGDFLTEETPLPTAHRMPSRSAVGMVDPITGVAIQDFGGDAPMPDSTAFMDQSFHAPRVPIGGAEQSDMAGLLRTFYESGGDGFVNALTGNVQQLTQNVYDAAQHDSTLATAISTRATSNGVRVGGWEITTDKKDRYNVVSAESNQIIAKDLYIYEAAEALVSLLNKGMMINNIKVQKILQMEMDYAKHIEDAIQHKHTATRALERGDDSRLDIAKARFNESKSKALAAKKKILEHLK